MSREWILYALLHNGAMVSHGDPNQPPPWENKDRFNTGHKRNDTKKIKPMSRNARKRKAKRFQCLKP